MDIICNNIDAKRQSLQIYFLYTFIYASNHPQTFTGLVGCWLGPFAHSKCLVLPATVRLLFPPVVKAGLAGCQ